MASLMPTLRPTASWKSLIRHSRLRKSSQTIRTLTTAYAAQRTKVVQRYNLERAPAPQPKHISRHIKTYPPPSCPSQKVKDPVSALHALQIRTLDPNSSRTSLFSPTNQDGAKVGDILLVRLRTGDPFAGICINIRRRGVETAILLRNELTRVGVEMWFKIYSPNVEGVEVVQRRLKRARRARLTYLRKKKHDVGSLQGVVGAYLRSRSVARGGSAGAGGAQKKGKKKGKK